MRNDERCVLEKGDEYSDYGAYMEFKGTHGDTAYLEIMNYGEGDEQLLEMKEGEIYTAEETIGDFPDIEVGKVVDERTEEKRGMSRFLLRERMIKSPRS